MKPKLSQLISFRGRLLGLAMCVAVVSSNGYASGIRCEDAADTAAIRIETSHGPILLTSQTAIDLLEDQKTISANLKLKGAERKAALKTYFKQDKSLADIGLVFANYAMALGIGAKIAADFVAHPELIPTAALLIPPTLFATDFISGVFHKFLDSYASESNPLWGGSARAFRVHHEFPGHLNDLSYLENVSSFGRLMAPIYVASSLALPHINADVSSSALLMLMLFSNGTEIHRQAHLTQPAKVADLLQKTHILMSRKEHSLHHTAPTDTDFGIINAWSNPVTRPLWNHLDMIFWKATKKMPKNWIQQPQSIPDSVIASLVKDLSLVPQEFLVGATNARIKDERVENVLRLWIEKHASPSGSAEDTSTTDDEGTP